MLDPFSGESISNSVAEQIQRQMGLRRERDWKVPCFTLSNCERLREVAKIVREFRLPLSVDLGMGTNDEELTFLGRERGGIVIGIDNQYSPFPDFSDPGGDFAVVLVGDDVRRVPEGIAGFSQVLFPSQHTYEELVVSAAKVLQGGGEAFMTFDMSVMPQVGLPDVKSLFQKVHQILNDEGRFNTEFELVTPEVYHALYPPTPVARNMRILDMKIPIIRAIRL